MIESEEIRCRTWLHKWGVPIAHALLWIIGMLVTVDLFDKIDTWFPERHTKLGISLGTIIIIFFAEIIISFVDVVAENRIRNINITFLYYIALLLTTLILANLLMFLGCYFMNAPIGKILIFILIFVSAYAKGMEIWIQNNWDKYTVDIPVSSESPIINYENE